MKKKRKNHSDVKQNIEFIALMVTILGSAYTIDSKLDRRIEQTEKTMISQHTDFQRSLNEQSARSDRLYEMFIELVKEKR